MHKKPNSTHNQFNADLAPNVRPTIDRAAENPEILHFRHENVAVFGLNQVSRLQYIDYTTINEDFIEGRLATDPSCTLESIIIFSQRPPDAKIYDRIDAWFDTACAGTKLPLLTITGDIHPNVYCMTKSYPSSPNRIDVTVEAFSSGPLKISVIKDTSSGDSGHYFFVDDTELGANNNICPSYDF